MRLLKLLVPVMGLGACVAALAQLPTYHLGRTPGLEEIKAWDIAIGPAGKELPPGRGTVKEGATIYAQKCAVCHGPTGTEGPRNRLVGGKGPRQIVEYQFATPLWDIINRSMPYDKQGSLSADEVYALTAFLLQRNGFIQESEVMDAKSLPKVKMASH
jgi:cytochrome c